MPLSRNHPSSAFQELRAAVQALPQGLAAAMLEGVRGGQIIAGKFVGQDGEGMCPLLAARRNGAPVQLSGAMFPPAWDRYVGVKTNWTGRVKEPVAARPEQIALLVSLLEERLFPASEMRSKSLAEAPCPSCQRSEQIDLYGDCVFCSTPLVWAQPVGEPEPVQARRHTPERERERAPERELSLV